MIPSDLAARLRMLADATFFGTDQPVAALQRSREILSRLPELVPGQRFQATLQRTLPDGTFRAVVAGQQMTLALSSSAQAGDTLELVVTETTPKAVFARLAEPETPAGNNQPSAQTALSQTGRLIGSLLTGQPETRPTALAGGQPLTPAPPTQGSTLSPALQQAVSESGLFYEAHLAKWLSGQTTTAALLREPQGQFANVLRVLLHAVNAATPSEGESAATPEAAASSSPADARTPASGTLTPETLQARLQTALLREPQGQLANLLRALQGAANPGTGSPSANAPPATPGTPASSNPAGLLGTSLLAALTAEAEATPEAGMRVANGLLHGEPSGTMTSRQATSSAPPAANTEAQAARQPVADEGAETGRAAAETRAPAAGDSAPRPQLIPERLMPLVHQQLDALATQTYVWQGQVWPGQTMEWEIEDGDRGRGEGEEENRDWNTTVRIRLPRLGGIEAQLHLTAAGVAVRLLAADSQTAEVLAAGQDQLARALDAANLPLTGMVVEHGQPR